MIPDPEEAMSMQKLKDVALMMMTEQSVSVNYLGKQAVSFMGAFTSVGHHRIAF